MQVNKKPIPKLWQYRHDDKRTWKYLDCIVIGSRDSGTIKISKWIKNPTFAYDHLDTNRCYK